MNPTGVVRGALSIIAGAALGLGPTVASGAGPEPAATSASGVEPDGRPAQGIEEMTITARKRVESAEKTPISVSVFSSGDIADRGIFRIDELGAYTPNMQFGSAGGTPNAGRVIVRGITNNDPIATRDPGVGVYLDGIYLSRAQGMLLGLGDVERVEVLRGPQGTLFGRNTIGGAINVITRKPEADRFKSDATLRLGNYGLLETSGTVNIPLVAERSAARISFQTGTRDGYTKNSLTGQRTDDQKLLAVRGSLWLAPTDGFEALFTGEQSRSHTSGRGGECRLAPGLIDDFPVSNAEVGLSGLADECRRSAGGDELTYESPIRTNARLDTWALGSTLTWELPGVTVKSLSSWRRQRNSWVEDYTYSALNVGRNIADRDKQDQITQELNLGGSALEKRLQWTAGLFGIHEKITPGLLDTQTAFNLCEDGRVTAFCEASLTSRVGGTTTAYAAYGQATYDLTPQVHVTAGLRRSLEHKTLDYSSRTLATDATTFNPRFVQKGSERYRGWTPLVSVSYDVTPVMMAYATWSKGFKSGGFNGRPNPKLPESLRPFDQEDLQNYEVGLKSSWFERRLIADVSLFHNDYDNIQQTVLSVDPGSGAFASRVANAGKAVVRGAEFELRALPLVGLDLRASLGFTDAKYLEFTDTRVRNCSMPTESCDVTTADRSAEPFFGTPNFTASFGAAYTFALAQLGSLTTSLHWSHQNPVNFGQAGSTLKQHKVGLLGGRLSLELPDGKTTLAVFGENLLDRRYINSGINFEQGFALSVAFWAPPRMWGVEVRRSFE